MEALLDDVVDQLAEKRLDLGLGELGEAEATAALTAALDDENEWVRLEACGALRKLKATSAVGKLRRLAEGDENEQ